MKYCIRRNPCIFLSSQQGRTKHPCSDITSNIAMSASVVVEIRPYAELRIHRLIKLSIIAIDPRPSGYTVRYAVRHRHSICRALTKVKVSVAAEW